MALTVPHTHSLTHFMRNFHTHTHRDIMDNHIVSFTLAMYLHKIKMSACRRSPFIASRHCELRECENTFTNGFSRTHNTIEKDTAVSSSMRKYAQRLHTTIKCYAVLSSAIGTDDTRVFVHSVCVCAIIIK